MGRLFWIIIALIGGVILLLIANDGSGTTLGMTNDAFAEAAYYSIWGLVLGAVILGSGIPLGDFVRNLAIWVMIILALVAGYQYRFELQEAANRITAGLIPGSPISSRNNEGRVTVALEKSRSGHFEVSGRVNGASVNFMIDTGASSVVLSASDARKAGLDPEKLSYTAPVYTANGTAQAALVRLDQLKIGDIERHGVRAMVVQEGLLTGSLLGMNFLETLSSFSVAGDQLILTD
ncbi:MAG: TIGR02281 family clan AA aspartic protease [Phyllobacterium sp.]